MELCHGPWNTLVLQRKIDNRACFPWMKTFTVQWIATHNIRSYNSAEQIDIPFLRVSMSQASTVLLLWLNWRNSFTFLPPLPTKIVAARSRRTAAAKELIFPWPSCDITKPPFVPWVWCCKKKKKHSVDYFGVAFVSAFFIGTKDNASLYNSVNVKQCKTWYLAILFFNVKTTW